MHSAELVFINGNILTLDPTNPQAQAVAVRGGRLHTVGSEAAVREQIGPRTEVIDLQGKTLLPGFNDSHLHLVYTGVHQLQVNCTGCRSVEDLIAKVQAKAAVTPPGQWLVGMGWDQNLFSEGRFPTRHDLDRATTRHPVSLGRTCGHVVVYNSLALELAGITRDTPNPPGGEIDHDPAGDLLGTMRESANALVRHFYSPWPRELARAGLRLAAGQAIAAGLTSVTTDDAHFVGGYTTCFDLYREFWAAGEPMVRSSQLIFNDETAAVVAAGLKTGDGDERLRVGAIKIFQDGGLGGRTAWLREPYTNDPNSRGVFIYPQAEIDALVAQAHKNGLQVAIHAIGDAALDSSLDAIEQAQTAHPRPNPRHRLVHYDVLDETILRRSVELGIVADIQPLFLAMNGRVAESFLGPDRARLTYPWKTIIDRGIPCGGGSDSPVVSFSPLTGIWSAVTRHADYNNSSPAYYPAERLTVLEALRLYTIGSAYTTFEENIKGTITPGKLADLVVLSDDPCRVDPDDIRDIRVEMTVIDGKIVYTAS